jgi:hypothetical protein
MIDNPQQANKMAKSARTKSNQYNIDVSVERHLHLYAQLVE